MTTKKSARPRAKASAAKMTATKSAPRKRTAKTEARGRKKAA